MNKDYKNAIKTLKEYRHDEDVLECGEKFCEALDIVIEAFETSRPKGKWIRIEGTRKEKYKCFNCGQPMRKILIGDELMLNWTDFCPECGADMRGKDDDGM